MSQTHQAGIDELSALLRSFRLRCGISQQELGERMGLSQKRIAAMERAPGSVSVKQFYVWLECLGVKCALEPRHGEIEGRSTLRQGRGRPVRGGKAASQSASTAKVQPSTEPDTREAKVERTSASLEPGPLSGEASTLQWSVVWD